MDAFLQVVDAFDVINFYVQREILKVLGRRKKVKCRDAAFAITTLAAVVG